MQGFVKIARGANNEGSIEGNIDGNIEGRPECNSGNANEGLLYCDFLNKV